MYAGLFSGVSHIVNSFVPSIRSSHLMPCLAFARCHHFPFHSMLWSLRPENRLLAGVGMWYRFKIASTNNNHATNTCCTRHMTAGWRAFLAELAAAMKAHVDPAATVSVDICGNCGGSDYMGMFAGNWTGIGLEIVSMCGRIRTSAPPTINTRPVPRAERTTRSTQGSPAYPSPTAKRQPVLGLVRGFRRGIRMLASCVASCDWLRERT